MRPDPLCHAVSAALAAGEPADPAHLVTCAPCRARAELVGVLGGPTRVERVVPGPTAEGLRSAVRVRAARRAAVVGTLLVLVGAAAFGLRSPAAADIDLLAVLDDADRAVAPVELADEDLLALVDPLDDDPFEDDPSAPDPLLDALLGEGSL
ncbi:MAG: hypothetical protein Q8P18_18790 [Pseudomonadota bacterium]|nr:hypothetical protein [Pseudomonadota bacterium]